MKHITEALREMETDNKQPAKVRLAIRIGRLANDLRKCEEELRRLDESKAA